ncbi:MAG: hypothetical protein AB1611_12955 [bacterium]
MQPEIKSESDVERERLGKLPDKPMIADMEYAEVTAMVSIDLRSPSSFYYP